MYSGNITMIHPIIAEMTGQAVRVQVANTVKRNTSCVLYSTVQQVLA